MTIEYTWSVEAKTVPESNGFSDVIETVFFRCSATDGTRTVHHRGSVNLPPPTNAETFVDLAQIAESPDRRALVIGWAGALRPGLIAETEAVLAGQLEQQQAQGSTIVL